MRSRLLLIAMLALGSIQTQALGARTDKASTNLSGNSAGQLKCVVLRIYSLTEVGTLVQLDENKVENDAGETTVIKPNQSTFFVEVKRGLIMGDLSNVMFERVEMARSRVTARGLTLSMATADRTSYFWLDTSKSEATGKEKAAQSVVWVNVPYVYTGICR